MPENNRYHSLIFTNHALQRIKERKMAQHMAWETFNHPDGIKEGKNPGTKEYQKHFSANKVTIILTQNKNAEWVVLSCWIDPPLPGTRDYKSKEYYYAYQKAGFWGKFWLTIKNQLGF